MNPGCMLLFVFGFVGGAVVINSAILVSLSVLLLVHFSISTGVPALTQNLPRILRYADLPNLGFPRSFVFSALHFPFKQMDKDKLEMEMMSKHVWTGIWQCIFYNTLKFHCLLLKQVQGQFVYLSFRELLLWVCCNLQKNPWVKLMFSVLSGTWLILCSHKRMQSEALYH